MGRTRILYIASLRHFLPGSHVFRLVRSRLESYRDDLVRADAEGRNLLTLKYVRMEKSIPQLSDPPPD